MRRRAWHHMMDLPGTPPQAVAAPTRERLRRDGGSWEIRASEWACTIATHPRHMSALYNIGLTSDITTCQKIETLVGCILTLDVTGPGRGDMRVEGGVPDLHQMQLLCKLEYRSGVILLTQAETPSTSRAPIEAPAEIANRGHQPLH